MIKKTFPLLDELAGQAQSAGVLRDAMKKSQIEKLFTTMEKLTELEPPSTEEEIETEIAAARAERAPRRRFQHACLRIPVG